MNEDLQKIAQAIKEKDNFLILPHIFIDGDDLGSMLSFAQVLKSLGKNYYLYSIDGVSDTFDFLSNKEEIHTTLPAGANFDVAIVLECSSLTRLPEGFDLRATCSEVINIDHHPINDLPADYSWIDPSFCALGEMLYFLYKDLGVELNREAAEALYTSIVSDSAGFRYSSVSPRTHLVAAHLLEILGDISYIHRAIFSSYSANELKLYSMALATLQLHHHGKIVSAYVTAQMLESCHLQEKDLQSLVGQLNVVKGSEIFVLFKAIDTNKIRVSLRSIEAPVNTVAAKHNGGGHKLAAACTLECISLEEAMKFIIPEAIELLNQ